jgi:hypothetical protein
MSRLTALEALRFLLDHGLDDYWIETPEGQAAYQEARSLLSSEPSETTAGSGETPRTDARQLADATRHSSDALDNAYELARELERQVRSPAKCQRCDYPNCFCKVAPTTETGRTLDLAKTAIKAMAEDGWLMHGVEGMSEPQQRCYEAYMKLGLADLPENLKPSGMDLRRVIAGHEDGDTYVKVRRTDGEEK